MENLESALKEIQEQRKVLLPSVQRYRALGEATMLIRKDKAMTNDAIDLLPCPFCGGAGDEHGTVDSDWVSCNRCDAATDIFDAGSGEHITAWNTRAAPQITPEMRERCYGVVEKAVLEVYGDSSGASLISAENIARNAVDAVLREVCGER